MGTRSLSTSSGGDSTSSSPIVGIIRHSIYMRRRSTNTYIYSIYIYMVVVVVLVVAVLVVVVLLLVVVVAS